MSFPTDYDNAHPVRSCTRKKAYPTEEIARSAVRSIREGSPDADVRAYACRSCGSWHVGASPGAVKTDADLDPLRPRRSKRPRRVPYDAERAARKLRRRAAED